MVLAESILKFYNNLIIPDLSHMNVEVLVPFEEEETRRVMHEFFYKYYNDSNPRTMLIGINPGRYGGGITGIPFTDPINLEVYCGIKNTFSKRHELSSKFMYDMIESFGGPAAFFGKYYFYSVSPVGFTKEGKNYNYYDNQILKQYLEPFIVNTMEQHLDMGMAREKVFSLGQGKNVEVLQELSTKYNFFDKIIPLPHPRWVMQYRLKKKNLFIQQYLRQFL